MCSKGNIVAIHPDFTSLFGKRYEDETVAAFLAGHPPHTLDKPSDGDQYLLCKAGGFDLLFEDPDTRGPGRKQDRRLVSIFLFNEGVQGHRRYTGVLPYDFSFDDVRATLRSKRKPDFVWVLGEGRATLDHPNPDSDTWALDGLKFSAHYAEGDDAPRYFTINPPVDGPEWVAPDSWQKLALIPGRLAEAIKLYRAENAVGIAEAKAAIDRYAAEH